MSTAAQVPDFFAAEDRQPPDFIPASDSYASQARPSELITPGNVDLYSRPKTPNQGKTSTVFSMGFDTADGNYAVVPGVALDGSRVLSPKEAWAQYERTGKHLGIFKNRTAGDAFAKKLHEEYEAGKYDRASPAVEMAPFPVDDWVNHQVKDLPPEEQAAKRSGFASVMYDVARPWMDLGYSAAAGLNRGMANFSTELDLLARHFERVTGAKRGGGFEEAAKAYEANAELLQSMYSKEGVTAVEKVYRFGGEAVGGMIPGTAQFLMDRGSALLIPYATGDESARLHEQDPVIGGLVRAGETGMLAGMFKMVEPLKMWLKAGVLGTYFGANEAINAKPGEGATGFLRGAAVGGLLGMTTPGGKYGLRDIYPEIGRNAPKAETVSAPEPVPPEPAREGLRPAIQTQQGIVEGKPGQTHPDVVEQSGVVESEGRPAAQELTTARPLPADLEIKNTTISSSYAGPGTLLHVEFNGDVPALSDRDPMMGEAIAKKLFPELADKITEARVGKRTIFTATAGAHHLQIEFKDAGSAKAALSKLETSQPALSAPAGEQGSDTARGFVNPEGEFLDREQAKDWVQKNEPDVFEEWQLKVGENAEFHSEDYNVARETVAASRRPLPLGAASALPMDNPPRFQPRTEPQGIWGSVGRIFNSMYKATTIDIVPELSDAGVSNNAVQHAHARTAAPKIVDDLLSRVFPEEYKNPKKMAPFIDILNKDNILGGYDSFRLRASEERAQGNSGDKWDALASAVEEAHDLAAYDADVQKAKGNKKFMETVERWQDHVSPALDQLYNEMKQVDSFTQRDSRGRYLDSRINLLSEDHAAQWTGALEDTGKPLPEPSASSYRNPNVKRDPTDFMAKFTGAYSTDARAVLSAVVGHRWNEVTKMRFYNDLIESGTGIVATGEPPEGYSRMPFRVPSTDSNGHTRMIEQPLFVPKKLVSEIRSVLGTDMRLEPNAVGKILTNIQLAQLVDLTTHTKNIISVVTRAQGAGDIWTDVGRKVPGIGSVDALWRLAKTTREVLHDTPEIRAEISEMARRGLVRPQFPPTGLQKITRGQQIIHEADTAARVVMNRFFDNLVERKLAVDTEENRRGFVNQVGEYNSRLQGPIMRKMKESGLSPFIVAGRNFNRQGRWAISGNPGVEAASMNAAVQMRVLNLLGTTALFTLPMLLNHLTTGTMAGRSGTPVGAWDLGLEPGDDGKHKVIDLLNWTGARRGMRSIGLDAFARGLMNGDHLNDMIGNGLQDAGNTIIHPWNGPAVSFVAKALTGKQLDIRGTMEAEKLPEGGGLQYLENFRAALESQNALVYSIVRPAFQEVGLDQKIKPGYAEDVVRTLLKAPAQAAGARDITPPPTEMERLKRDLEIQKARQRKDLEYQMGVDRKAQKKKFTILKRRMAEE